MLYLYTLPMINIYAYAISRANCTCTYSPENGVCILFSSSLSESGVGVLFSSFNDLDDGHIQRYHVNIADEC